jgi:hypothetical protein
VPPEPPAAPVLARRRFGSEGIPHDQTLARIRLLVTERPTFRHSCAIYEPAAPSKGQSMGYCCPKNDYFGMIDAKLNKSSYRNGNSGAR